MYLETMESAMSASMDALLSLSDDSKESALERVDIFSTREIKLKLVLWNHKEVIYFTFFFSSPTKRRRSTAHLKISLGV